MTERTQRLPNWFLIALGVACGAPLLANGFGVWFGFADSPPLTRLQEFQAISLHSLLEWTAVCVAFVTTLTAFSHYSIRRDVTTPIIGTALFYGGVLDAVHTLAMDHLLPLVADPTHFAPFMWGMSRMFHATIVAIGVAPFAVQANAGRYWAGWRSLVVVSIVFGLGAFSVVFICASIPNLPATIYPENFVPRPFDAIALMIYLLAGGLFLPQFYRQQPSLFSHGLMVSLAPHLLAQVYTAFFSYSQYDNAATVGQYLKILAYLTPFLGLLFDYTRAYKAEARLRTTEAMLQVAKTVQQSLLPQEAPTIPGYDLAAFSLPSGDVGGDYYDYISLNNGDWLLLVADVSGHDIGASILMSQTRAYLRAQAEAETDPGVIAGRLNRFLDRDIRDRRFVSLFLGRLTPATGKLTYVAAGHPGYVLTAKGQRQELLPTAPILGVTEEGLLPVETVFVTPGGTLALFTDGLPESRNPQGVLLGTQRVIGFLQAYNDQMAAPLAQSILKALRTYTRGLPPDDDLTLLVVKRAVETPR